MEERKPIYSTRAPAKDIEAVASYETATPWKASNISFYYTNFDYPFLHTHRHWELFIITEGACVHHLNGRAYVMQKGSACLIRPQDRHKLNAYQNKTVQTITFIIKPEYMQALLRFYDLGELTAEDLSFTLSPIQLNNLMRNTLVIQSMSLSDLKDKEMRCRLLFSELISDLINQRMIKLKKMPDCVVQILEMLSNPLLREVSIKNDLAKTTNYSYSNVLRIFKKYTGYTILQYVQTVKINYATELLKNSDMRIIEIAETIGYDSIANFNKLFKRNVGMTPTEYRRKYKFNQSDKQDLIGEANKNAYTRRKRSFCD